MYPVLFRFPEWLPLLGGEPVTSFGVMMFLAFLTAGYLQRAQMAEAGMDADKAWDLLFMAVLGGIGGAKLYYVFLNYDQLVANPGFLFSRGGLVWYGGFLGAAALVLWQMKRSNLPMGQTSDFAAPGLALAYAVGRLGCFLVGDDYGRATDSWVGIRFPEGSPPSTVSNLERQFNVAVDPALVEKYGEVVPVHPTQLYEVGMSLLIFAFLWKIRKHDHQKGWLFMHWLALAGTERFLVEFLRAKDDRFFGIFTMAQMISLAIVVVGVLGMQKLREPGSTRGARRRAAARS